MQNKWTLAGAFLIPLIVVAVMLAMAVSPLWTGREVRVEVQGYDPRDIMRGDYARFRYPFNSIRLDSVRHDFKIGSRITYGQVVYAEIDEGSTNGTVKALYSQEPDSVKFLMGRARVPSEVGKNTVLELRFGIEEFYTSPETAQAIENDIRSDSAVVVHLRVDSEGRSRISELSGVSDQ